MAFLMNSVQLTNISDTLLYDIHHLTTAADLSKLQALYKFSNIQYSFDSLKNYEDNKTVHSILNL